MIILLLLAAVVSIVDADWNLAAGSLAAADRQRARVLPVEHLYREGCRCFGVLMEGEGGGYPCANRMQSRRR